MIADTMGSTEYDSTDELRKAYCCPEANFYAVCAGNMNVAGEIAGMIQKALADLKPKTYGTISALINRLVNLHRSERFRWEVMVPKYEVPGLELANFQQDLLKEFCDYDVGADMLVGTFDNTGTALLFELCRLPDSAKLVHPIIMPGFGAIGTGSYNASFWLKYRQQHLARSVRQSAYHAFEACSMAAKTPTVNERTDLIVASKGAAFCLSDRSPKQAGCPVSIPELRKLMHKYGPQKTEALGFD